MNSVAIWEDRQRLIDSNDSEYAEPNESDNTDTRMPAMRALRSLKCPKLQGFVTSKRGLKMPPLRLADEEVAEYLHARNRLELFRVDEIGVVGEGA